MFESNDPSEFAPYGEPSPTGGDAAPATWDPLELALRYLGLVHGVVARMKSRMPSHIDASDLHSIGVIGLMDALKKYDPAQEHTFAGFAIIRIRGAILDELRRMDSCSRRTRCRRRELEAAINDVEQRLGRNATTRDMCEALGMDRESYLEWVKSSTPIRLLSLDRANESGERSDSSLHDMLMDDNDETGRDRLEKSELTEQLTGYLETLPETPRKILAMYYGENLTFNVIAQAFGLTETRICQIHRITIKRLRKWIKIAREA